MGESQEAFETRLLRAISRAGTAFLEQGFVWRPLGAEAPAAEAIACLRDGDSRHQFVPAGDRFLEVIRTLIACGRGL